MAPASFLRAGGLPRRRALCPRPLAAQAENPAPVSAKGSTSGWRGPWTSLLLCQERNLSLREGKSLGLSPTFLGKFPFATQTHGTSISSFNPCNIKRLEVLLLSPSCYLEIRKQGHIALPERQAELEPSKSDPGAHPSDHQTSPAPRPATLVLPQRSQLK